MGTCQAQGEPVAVDQGGHLRRRLHQRSGALNGGWVCQDASDVTATCGANALGSLLCLAWLRPATITLAPATASLRAISSLVPAIESLTRALSFIAAQANKPFAEFGFIRG